MWANKMASLHDNDDYVCTNIKRMEINREEQLSDNDVCTCI